MIAWHNIKSSNNIVSSDKLWGQRSVENVLFNRSSSWVPCSTRLPLSNTAMLSAFRTVESRCATKTIVRPPSPISRSSACCTNASLSVSRELVASSKSKILGRRSNMRAIAIRCRYSRAGNQKSKSTWSALGRKRSMMGSIH